MGIPGAAVLGTGLGVYIPIVLYVAFIVTCLLTLFKNPRIGLYLLAVVIPLQRLRLRLIDYPMGANLVTLLVLCVLVGGFFRGMRPRLGLLAAPLVAMIAYLYLSLWWGAIYSGGEIPLWLNSPRFVVYKDYVAMLLLPFAASMVLENRRQVMTLLGCVFLSLLLVDRSALLEFLTRDMSHYSDDKRASGPFGNIGANELAAFLSQFALFTFGFSFQSELSRKLRWLLYGLAALTTVTLLYTFSRGAYVAFLVGLFAFALLRSRKTLVLLALFLVCWQAAVPTAVEERIMMTSDANDRLDESAEQRLVMWKDAVERFEHSPLLGSGYGSFNSTMRSNGLRDTHNWYLKVLADTGLIGLGLVVWLLTAMWRTAWRAYKVEDRASSAIGLGLLLALSSLLVANLFGDRWSYIEINGCLWMVLASAQSLLQCEGIAEGAGATLAWRPTSPREHKESLYDY